jgi:hypothetical protein
MTAASRRRALSDAERAERRAEERERIATAAAVLLTSEGWQRWVRVRARNGLARYSMTNQLLIALARPDATFVAGFHAWLDLGYCVTKGERAIRILAPVRRRRRDDADEDGDRPVAFRSVAVFDRSQVRPLEGRDPAPLEPPCEPLTGDSHAHLLQPLEQLASELGFGVTYRPIAGATGGWCDPAAKEIVIDADAPPNARVRTLVHEITHALGVHYDGYGRERAEVIVDTVTYVVCAGAGLDVGGETIPYVAGWGEDGGLEAVAAFAETIDRLARRIDDAIRPDVERVITEA